MIHTVKKLNQEIKSLARTGKEIGGISDTYHTFDELYAHRVALFITLSNQLARWEKHLENKIQNHPWKARKHHDGTMFAGSWFIAGIGTESGRQISYHLPLEDWDKLECEELEKAPVWDGHTPENVVERLTKLFEPKSID